MKDLRALGRICGYVIRPYLLTNDGCGLWDLYSDRDNLLVVPLPHVFMSAIVTKVFSFSSPVTTTYVNTGEILDASTRSPSTHGFYTFPNPETVTGGGA